MHGVGARCVMSEQARRERERAVDEVGCPNELVVKPVKRRGKARSHGGSSSRGRNRLPQFTMSPPLALNCLLLGEEPSRTITIKIQATETVAILKKAIWTDKQNRLKDVDAGDLILWMVRRRYTDYCID